MFDRFLNFFNRYAVGPLNHFAVEFDNQHKFGFGQRAFGFLVDVVQTHGQPLVSFQQGGFFAVELQHRINRAAVAGVDKNSQFAELVFDNFKEILFFYQGVILCFHRFSCNMC